MFAFFAGGLVFLLRARAGRIPPAMWLDGLITALAVAATGAALVFGVVASTEGSFATVATVATAATNLGYPLGDLALLAFAVAVIAVTGWRPGRTWLLIVAGFGAFAVADTIYLYQAALDTYVENTILDLGWPAAYLLVAFAAWQPAKSIDPRAVLRSWAMFVLPAASALASLGLLIFDHYPRLNSLAIWLASGTLLVGVARFPLAFRANVRMLRASETDATTDPLTGSATAALSSSTSSAPRGRPRMRPTCSRRSTSTASRPTTTRSATRPATRSSSASA